MSFSSLLLQFYVNSAVSASDAGSEEESLQRICEFLKDPSSGLEIKDRKHHLRTYRQCFVGKDFIDWFITRGIKREDILVIATKMIEQKFIEHVLQEHS